MSASQPLHCPYHSSMSCIPSIEPFIRQRSSASARQRTRTPPPTTEAVPMQVMGQMTIEGRSACGIPLDWPSSFRCSERCRYSKRGPAHSVLQGNVDAQMQSSIARRGLNLHLLLTAHLLRRTCWPIDLTFGKFCLAKLAGEISLNFATE